MKAIDVMIAEDYRLYRNGIVQLLSLVPQVRVTGEASNGRELLAIAQTAVPDVVLMDISMPEMDGIEATRELLERYPKTGVIALTMHNDDWYLAQMVLAGARGYLYKESTENVLAAAIEEVHEGGCYYFSKTQQSVTTLLKKVLTTGMLPDKPGHLLTEEEVTYIRLIGEGYLHKEIVDIMGLTLDKVKKLKVVLMEKTGARTWADVIRYAMRHNQL